MSELDRYRLRSRGLRVPTDEEKEQIPIEVEHLEPEEAQAEYDRRVKEQHQ